MEGRGRGFQNAARRQQDKTPCQKRPGDQSIVAGPPSGIATSCAVYDRETDPRRREEVGELIRGSGSLHTGLSVHRGSYRFKGHHELGGKTQNETKRARPKKSVSVPVTMVQYNLVPVPVSGLEW